MIVKRSQKPRNSPFPPKLSWLSHWGICGLALILGLLDLEAINRLGFTHLFSLHLLVILAIANSLGQRKRQLCWESDRFSIGLGGTAIALVLLRSQMPLGYHPHLSLLVFGVGLALIASGWKQISFYRKEIIALGILALYSLFHWLLLVLNWQVLTAKAATFSLNLIGMVATQQDNRVILPTGRVEVYGSCAGIDLMILLVVIVSLFLLQFPLKKWQGLSCFVVAIALAFIINSLRIALLSILIAQHNRVGFDYWHGDEGGWIFSLVAIAFWGLWCWYAFIKPSLASPPSNVKK